MRKIYKKEIEKEEKHESKKESGRIKKKRKGKEKVCAKGVDIKTKKGINRVNIGVSLEGEKYHLQREVLVPDQKIDPRIQ